MGITFDAALRTGNDLIDTQHQELIDRVNKLTDQCKVGSEKRVAVNTLDFLLDYTQKHFSDEEVLQSTNNYPLLDAHKVQHAIFVKSVKDLEDMLVEEEGPTEAFVEAVRKNVVEWLVNHIMVWDKQVAQYLQEN